MGDTSIRAQYADALISCNKYRQINYQLPNEVILRSTLPRATMPSPPKTKLDDREIDRSTPQFASSHAMHVVESTAQALRRNRDPHPDRKPALGFANGLLRGSHETARR